MGFEWQQDALKAPRNKMDTAIPLLPLPFDLETKPVLKALARAHRALAELKGTAGIVPNETILISTLSLQEAKDSSAIENIVTTQDDLYRSDAATAQFASLAAKEVHAYARALREGFERVRETGLITNNDILQIQATLEANQRLRKLPGTALKNDQTGETVFTPPQSHAEILALMDNLERFINEDGLSDLDPLVKMAVIHHRFETIHPFYDGNGRTGRILNILYLVKEGLLSTPILYLSRYVIQNKAGILPAAASGARRRGVGGMAALCAGRRGANFPANDPAGLRHPRPDAEPQEQAAVGELPRVYSQDLLNNLFRHPYTKIEFVMADLGVHRNTATRYLEAVASLGLVSKHRIGKENYFLNNDLFNLFLAVGGGAQCWGLNGEDVHKKGRFSVACHANAHRKAHLRVHEKRMG